jgi:hypothetical protein
MRRELEEDAMEYLISVIDDGQGEAAGDVASATEGEDAAIDAFNDRMRSEGRLRLAVGLAAPATTLLIDSRDAQVVVEPGPLHRSESYVAGLWILEAAGDAQAQDLATEASRACNRRVELRAVLAP